MKTIVESLRDTRILLAAGVTFMAAITMSLILMRVDKEYVITFSGFVGQLIAALLTYVTRETSSGNGGTK